VQQHITSDDGFMWTETCWSSFYNFNYFNLLAPELFF
jgi:hypothetical protein